MRRLRAIVREDKRVMSKSKVFESKQLWLGEARGGVCAWGGCQAAFASDELPKGWSWLILYRSKRQLDFSKIPARDALRDTQLCPQHTAALDAQLKDLGRAVSGPPAGSA